MHKRFTNRLAELRLKDQSESFEKTLADISEFGVGIIHVAGDEQGLGWSYSTGLYDTYGQPEILLSGAPVSLAHFVINEIGRRYEKFESLRIDEPIAGLIGNDIDCILKPLEPIWKDRLMLRTNWFYGNTEYPAMQCVYPDLQNNFPWDASFDKNWRTRQALLYPGSVQTKLEKTFWMTASDRKSNN